RPPEPAATRALRREAAALGAAQQVELVRIVERQRAPLELELIAAIDGGTQTERLHDAQVHSVGCLARWRLRPDEVLFLRARQHAGSRCPHSVQRVLRRAAELDQELAGDRRSASASVPAVHCDAASDPENAAQARRYALPQHLEALI